MKNGDFFASGMAVRVTALWAGLGVALGAFGAHAWKPVLLQRMDGPAVWSTALMYHLLHAVAMLVTGQPGWSGGGRMAWWFFAGGSLLFSGSLYLLTGMGWRFLGPVTPLGGAVLLAGWGTLVCCGGRRGD